MMEKALMNLKEVCAYTGWGQTKTREILNWPDSMFTVRVGNRIYVNKRLFDKYLEQCARGPIPI